MSSLSWLPILGKIPNSNSTSVKRGLLELPAEVLEQILYHAIQVRGIKRGMRLRLVNKTFARAVIHALHSFALINDMNTTSRKRSQIPREMASSYLEYQIIRSNPRSSPSWRNRLWHVAREIHKEQDTVASEYASFEACTRQLCSMLVNPEVGDRAEYMFYNMSYEHCLLVGALCTNTLSMIMRDERLLSVIEFCSRSVDKYSYYTHIAAAYSNTDILEFLITCHPKAARATRASLFQNAALAGRLEVVKFLYNFRKIEMPWDVTNYDSLALATARHSCHVDILKFLETIDGESILQRRSGCWKHHLIRVREHGTMETVRYLIEQLKTRKDFHRTHVEMVCSGVVFKHAVSKEDLDYLIENGARPEKLIALAAKAGRKDLVEALVSPDVDLDEALLEAVRGPYLDIFDVLVRCGGYKMEVIKDGSLLPFAIELEHTKLVKVLLKHVDQPAAIQAKWVQCAKKKGLESMLHLLGEHGIDVQDKAIKT